MCEPGEVARLIEELDPHWTWAPLAYDSSGSPVVEERGQKYGLWVRVVADGRAYIGYGWAEPTTLAASGLLHAGELVQALVAEGKDLGEIAKAKALVGLAERAGEFGPQAVGLQLGRTPCD